jgi:hypothetical protein
MIYVLKNAITRNAVNTDVTQVGRRTNSNVRNDLFESRRHLILNLQQNIIKNTLEDCTKLL